MQLSAPWGPWRIALLTFVLLLVPKTGWAQWRLTSADCAFPVTKRHFNCVADDRPVVDADLDLGKTARAKIALPKPHPADLAASEAAYAAGRFAEAAAQLEPLVSQDLVDPTLLNQYARSLYKIPALKVRSYVAYQRLITLLDTYGREDVSTCVVYLLFCESYYKLGTLQMDNGQWRLAAYNISRLLLALNSVRTWKTPVIYEQALQYQTECFSELGDAKMCRHFGQLTLKDFPKNQYVRPYLARLPKPVTPKR